MFSLLPLTLWPCTLQPNQDLRLWEYESDYLALKKSDAGWWGRRQTAGMKYALLFSFWCKLIITAQLGYFRGDGVGDVGSDVNWEGLNHALLSG